MKKILKTTPTSGPDSVVFFGSGPVAARSLQLLARDFTIEAVVTKPRPAHHKDSFPVLDVARKLDLPIHEVISKKDLSDLCASNPFVSPVGILIDFGIIITQDVIDYFPRGIVNSHFSVLPDLRGADPISFAILSGQKTTGVSLMLLVEAMDEGPLISFGEYTLPADITTPVLTDHLIQLSHNMLQKELPRYFSTPDFKPAPQTITGRTPSYSRKLVKEDGLIDWHKSAAQIEREVRAFIDWPKSRTQLADKDVVITRATVVPDSGKPGSVTATKSSLVVHCGENSLQIIRLKPAGKNEMTAEAFINGHKQQLLTTN